MTTQKASLKSLDWTKGKGLIPAVVQDRRTRQVLMVGWMDRAALQKTLATGLVTFFSRSKKRLWTKGESSGNVLRLASVRCDCDRDTLLIEALPAGPACHTGAVSCFDRSQVIRGDRRRQGKTARSRHGFLPMGNGGGLGSLEILEHIIAERFRKRPRGSYTASLIAAGIDRMAQKVGEEAVEAVIAAKNESRRRLESEAADLLFHLMVLLKARGSSLGKVAQTLRERFPSNQRYR